MESRTRRSSRGLSALGLILTIFGIVIGLVVVVIALAIFLPRYRDAAAFEEAAKENRLQSYQGYLRAYPRGRHAGEALTRLFEMQPSAFADALCQTQVPVGAAVRVAGYCSPELMGPYYVATYRGSMISKSLADLTLYVYVVTEKTEAIRRAEAGLRSACEKVQRRLELGPDQDIGPYNEAIAELNEASQVMKEALQGPRNFVVRVQDHEYPQVRKRTRAQAQANNPYKGPGHFNFDLPSFHNPFDESSVRKQNERVMEEHRQLVESLLRGLEELKEPVVFEGTVSSARREFSSMSESEWRKDLGGIEAVVVRR